MEDKKNYRYKAYILGDEILKKRKSMLKNQEEIAEMINLDPKQLGEIERGNSLPNFITLIRLRKKLGISIDDIIDKMTE